jgi:hypothetical protein
LSNEKEGMEKTKAGYLKRVRGFQGSRVPVFLFKIKYFT